MSKFWTETQALHCCHICRLCTLSKRAESPCGLHMKVKKCSIGGVSNVCKEQAEYLEMIFSEMIQQIISNEKEVKKKHNLLWAIPQIGKIMGVSLYNLYAANSSLASSAAMCLKSISAVWLPRCWWDIFLSFAPALDWKNWFSRGDSVLLCHFGERTWPSSPSDTWFIEKFLVSSTRWE